MVKKNRPSRKRSEMGDLAVERPREDASVMVSAMAIGERADSIVYRPHATIVTWRILVNGVGPGTDLRRIVFTRVDLNHPPERMPDGTDYRDMEPMATRR